MSLRLGETIIAGSVDVNAIKQAVYDGTFPIGFEFIGFTAPGIPNGVTATWTDVSSDYNNRYFKVSTADAKTNEEQEMPSHNHGLTNGNAEIGMGWTAADNNLIVYQKGNGIVTMGGRGNVKMSQLQGYTDVGVNINNAVKTALSGTTDNSNTIVSGNVKPLTTTIKVWKRTA